MIIPIWKKIGQSTHLLAKKVGQQISQKTHNLDDLKATHTGTLDPMAEGVIVVLTGKDRYRKAEYSNSKKEYEFSILFGIDTDSHDLLGLQTKTTIYQLDEIKIAQNIKKILSKFTGKLEQAQPIFSAQRINGESAFNQAKKGKSVVAKKNNITVFSLEILNSTTIITDDLLSTIKEKINLIHGDFRQQEIIESWEHTIKKLNQNNLSKLPLIHLRTKVSKRTYIRSLVRDISKKLNIPATTFHIIRTKNGKYTKDDCKKTFL